MEQGHLSSCVLNQDAGNVGLAAVLVGLVHKGFTGGLKGEVRSQDFLNPLIRYHVGQPVATEEKKFAGTEFLFPDIRLDDIPYQTLHGVGHHYGKSTRIGAVFQAVPSPTSA
jgi:hypothetical protein